MRTIFHANRRTLPRPVYVQVYEHDGLPSYVVHYSRRQRELFEDYAYTAAGSERPNLYRINVYPKDAG